MRRAIVIAILAACSSQHESQPAITPEVTWARVDVAECGFSVELPGTVKRVVDTPPELNIPTTLYEAAGSPAGLLVECTVLPPDMELPPAEEVLRKVAARKARNLAGLGGGVVSTKVDLEPATSGAAVRSFIHFKNGKTDEALIMLVGRQVRDLSGMTDGSHEARADLDRLIASVRAP